ncbi:MAG: TetR/AcrR family transcriptional regulator [bacterium]|nr:TetR/AcrR family transcriptional regulator [bacterium]
MTEPKTFSKLREQEKDARRNIIIDAAEEEFATKPFNKVNMRDIAKKAGISPASIYRYFPDQQSLFVEAFLRGTKDIFQKLHDIVDEAPDGAIEIVITEFMDYFTRNDQYFRMMMRFFLDDTVDADVFERLSTMERTLLEFFDALLVKMNMKGNIRFHSHTMFAALVGIVGTFRNRPDKNQEDVLKHRKRIAHNLAEMFQSRAEKE